MSQSITIETITITRPLKVIALVCGCIVGILMIIGLVSVDWLMTSGWRQGLLRYCIEENAQKPLPFNVPDVPGCHPARDVYYIHVTAALCVLCFVADAFATIFTGLGLMTQNYRDKNKYYRWATFCTIFALLFLLIALVIYPLFFATELVYGNRQVWEFGWAYGVGWGAAIFLFSQAILLFYNKESKEIYYKERKIVHDDIGGGGNSMIGMGHHVGRSGTQLA